MMTLFSRLNQNQFLKHNAIFFVGSLMVGALNYVYYPILGRLLNPMAFGEVQTLISLFLQLNIFLTVFGLVTANIAANYQDATQRNRVIFDLERIALAISIVLLAATAIFRHQLQSFFQFSDAWPFVVMVMAIVLNVPTTLRTSFVTGQHGFGVASISNMLVALTKIGFSAALVFIGLSTVGALWGVVAAQGVALLFIAYWAYRLGLRRPAGTNWMSKPDFQLLAPELRYASLVLVGSLIITVQFSVDVIVIKHYFDAHTAGLYAGVATVARIVFFLSGSIAQVLMPSVKLRRPAAENRQLLLKSFGFLAATSLPVLALFAFAPSWIIGLLMGNQYDAYATLLPYLGATIFVAALMNLLVSYHMALRHYRVAAGVVLGSLVTAALMILHHDSLAAVVTNMCLGSLSIMAFVGALTLWPTRPKQVMELS